MSDLTTYLASPRAVEDVRALLAGRPGVTRGTISLWRREADAWAAIASAHGGKHRDVYYRPDGDRYIVTDLGEAVRALRLRTGCMGDRQDRIFAACDDHRIGLTGDSLRMDDVHPADLPRAIVAVLLAAHRVATLEVG